MQISVKPQFCILFVLLLLVVPLPLFVGWITAIIIHELCHIGGVLLCGGKIINITVGAGGICMESTPLTEGKRIFTILCGPVGGLLPMLFGRFFPFVAICCWGLSIYNLLPLLPLDGGRVLKILIRNEKHFLWAQRILLLILTLLALYGAFFLRLGILPLVFVGFFWVRNRKFPCK